jgi:hypothetical protein
MSLKFKTTQIVYLLIAMGVIVRILYFQKYGIMVFQHDWHGHIEFIKYIAENWSLPLVTKGLESPQQPLYYITTGGLYQLQINFGLADKDALYGLGYFSLLCSFIFLWYSHRVVELLSKSVWVRTVTMAFLSLTPSIVYLSARINNDTLVMALSAISLYYIVKSYQSNFTQNFYIALLSVSLLFLTKVSTASFELLLFALLIVAYRENIGEKKENIKRALYWFGVVGVFLLGFIFLRVYLPIDNTFHMVNSAKFPNQTIEHLDFSYFTTFHIKELFNAGYSFVFGEDKIRYSFLTYQYGTMLFGEFDYTYFINRADLLSYVMKTILLLALIYPLGFLLYLLKIYKESLLNRMLIATIFINLILIIKFMFEFPSICNTDFRYFVPSFILIGFLFGKGLERIRGVSIFRWIIDTVLVLLVLSEISFFALLV